MFDFKNANEDQMIAISSVTGPLLITAGPGTGKTFTLVQRAVYMIQEQGILPEQIMIATFTEKAAKELITRITNELMDRNIVVNINEMYIGTFHSICLRFIKQYLEFTRMKKNYRMIDSFDQQYMVFQNIGKFRCIDGFEDTIGERGAWKQASVVSTMVNNLFEELIDYTLLEMDIDNDIKIIGKIMRTYEDILIENNMLDFSAIQTEAYWLLQNNPDILAIIQNKIRYIMIDEYQDTNYIQEQMVFMLAGEKKNICVVGDDDQGLYRFRGATIRNILEFPHKFGNGECASVSLVINYRSDSKIVDFYNEWMSTTDGAKFKFDWGKFRFEKQIKPYKESKNASPTVIKVSGRDDEDEWHESIFNFINTLKESGKLTDLNQIAFLFNSVKNDKTVGLAAFLEKNGINVYSPRSDMFFAREEVMLALGCILVAFPIYADKIANRDFDFVDEDLCKYYEECIVVASKTLRNPDCKPLLRWIKEKGIIHTNLSKNLDYSFSGMLYQMFEYKPFVLYLDADLNNGAFDLRSTRNVAMLSQIIAKFEYLHRVNVFTSKTIDIVLDRFFNLYMRFLYNGGISEYEDDSEYAPSGCVSFLTIHQSKGMEFPIVVVGSLGNTPKNRFSRIPDTLEEKYYHRKAFEPLESIKYFDFWRQYYTAFSRAQDLLVLSCNEKTGRGRNPSMYFEDLYSRLTSFRNPEFIIEEFEFNLVKEVNLKETYSFTSHISVYESCSLQYKFFKELGFTPIRVGSTVFGTLVHQTIEDIHRSAIRKEENQITEDNIKKWFDTNYASITKSEHAYLAEPQLNAAFKQIINYVDRQKSDWSRIQETEVEVGIVKPNYILQGTIDLIIGDNNTVEIVDFKSEKKPNLTIEYERVEHYKKQLQVYAYLIEEKTGKKVSKMHLYYTGAENEVPTITFSKNDESITTTMLEFDNIVEKIQNKNFTKKAKSQTTCDNCDFRYYCSR